MTRAQKKGERRTRIGGEDLGDEILSFRGDRLLWREIVLVVLDTPRNRRDRQAGWSYLSIRSRLDVLVDGLDLFRLEWRFTDDEGVTARGISRFRKVS
jgi:hypothetical protein